MSQAISPEDAYQQWEASFYGLEAPLAKNNILANAEIVEEPNVQIVPMGTDLILDLEPVPGFPGEFVIDMAQVHEQLDAKRSPNRPILKLKKKVAKKKKRAAPKKKTSKTSEPGEIQNASEVV